MWRWTGPFACLALLGCGGTIEPCESDDQCKLGRVCQAGQCVHERPLVGRPTDVGDDCDREDALECHQDRALLCRDKKWDLIFQCQLGEFCGYVFERDAITCGRAWYTLAGYACSHEGAAACSFDRRRIFECTDGAWVEVVECATIRECGLIDVEGVSYVDCI